MEELKSKAQKTDSTSLEAVYGKNGFCKKNIINVKEDSETITQNYIKSNNDLDLEKIKNNHKICYPFFQNMRFAFNRKSKYYSLVTKDLIDKLNLTEEDKKGYIKFKIKNKNNGYFWYSKSKNHNTKDKESCFSYVFIMKLINDYEEVQFFKGRDMLFEGDKPYEISGKVYKGKNLITMFRCLKTKVSIQNRKPEDYDYFDVAHDPDKPGTEQF